MSDSLWPHGLQHTRLPCSSPSPGVCSESCPLSQRCYLSHPLSPPSSFASNLSEHQGLFQQVSSSHQEARVLSFSFSISPSDEYSGLISFRIDWFDLLSKGLSRVFSNTIVQKHQFFSAQPSLVQFSHVYMTTGKTTALTRWTFVGKACGGSDHEREQTEGYTGVLQTGA